MASAIIQQQDTNNSLQAAKVETVLGNEAARQLLREWLSETSGYDEHVWLQAKRVIDENRLSPRSRFDD